MKRSKVLGCGYQGHEFGSGTYPDSVCVDGYLWDADSGEGDGFMTFGGDDPCPECNHSTWLDYVRDDVEERGALAGYDGESYRENPYRRRIKRARLRFPADRRRMSRYWRRGWKAGNRDRIAEGNTNG